MIKKNFSFDNFYVYEGNKVAFMAAQKVVQFPGEVFNPLYVYATGSYGKTHFLWTLYTELSKKESAFIFTPREFEEYLQQNTQFDTAVFVDDINRVNERFQDSILAMIDILITKNKQLCFSGNAPPRELKNLGTKVISRIEGGLVCDLQAPREIALVEFIKKKSEERGIIVPDEIALELTQLSGGSLRTIDGMLNRLVAYASLGNITFDLNTIRLILKEFYPRGIYSPVASLVEELKKSADEVITEIAEVKDPRTEYKEKIYIWEMKGFDTSALKPLLDAEIDTLASAYNVFIKKVERLIELQKEFGALNVSKFPEDAMKIETMLFSPDKIEEIEALLNSIKERLKGEEKKPFRNYWITDCNRTVVELYEKTIIPSLGKEFNPYIVFGGAGTGKTFLCQTIAEDLKFRGYNPVIMDFESDTQALSELKELADVLLIDNFHKIFLLDFDLRNKLIENIIGHIKQEKGVFIFSEPFGDNVTLNDNEKMVLQLGIEANLKEPDPEITELYLKSKVSPEEYEIIKAKGIPEFKSFQEIDSFIVDLRKPQVVVEEKPAEEIISLGLPGEEVLKPAIEEPIIEKIEPREEITQIIEPAVEPQSKPAETQFKKLKEERLIIQELSDELLEENYVPLPRSE
ncbi:MAG: DnaA/Hda family protein [candidate division WOR-3 bacterium]